MKRLFFISLLIVSNVHSQDSKKVEGVIEVPLQTACPKTPKEILECAEPDAMTDLAAISKKLDENGCKDFHIMRRAVGTRPFDILVEDEQKKVWKLRLYFGNTRNQYFPTDVKLKTSTMDVKIFNLQARERPSDSYFKVWETTGGFQNYFRWIDEPNNTFKLALEKDGNEFYLSVFHPKYTFVQSEIDDQNTNVLVQGTVNGNQVNGYQHIKGEFDANGVSNPNQIHLTKWENSHYFLNWEVGYGKVIPLYKVRGEPIVKWTPQVSAGIFTGVNNSGEKFGQTNEVRYKTDKMKIMGVSGTIGNRISLTNRKDNIGIFVEHRFYLGKLKYDWGDGTAEHLMKSNSVTFGVQIGLARGKKRVTVPPEETQPLKIN